MKRPDGELHEEFMVSSCHFFEDGVLAGHDHSPDQGEYTGRFHFVFAGSGKRTRWYTAKSAPKWLLALYNEATGTRETEEAVPQSYLGRYLKEQGVL